MGERLGMRWGLAGGTMLRTVAEVAAEASWAGQVGFDSFWVSQAMAVDPVVALAAAANECGGLREVGTSVVPLYGRHPVGLAQSVRTTQSALGGRLTLGVGAAHRMSVEDMLGLSWDRPYSYTKEFLDAMLPLLEGNAVDVDGDQISAHAELLVDAAPTPVLLAGLGPRMLALAGTRTAGTTVGQCGPRTITDHIAPLVNEAAAAAGRKAPRIMALVRFCVTDDAASAYDLAREVSAFYSELPSYAAVLAREGLDHPADLHLIGSWSEILDGLAAYADAGVTDLRIEVAAPDERTRQMSRDALAEQLRD